MKGSVAVFPVLFGLSVCFDTDAFFKTRCEPKCVFQNISLSSKTIDLFPKTCSTVCSDMAIDENTDLTEEQLTSTFQNMKHLVGSLIVISTKYTSMKFMAPLESIECGDLNIIVQINSKMTEIGMTNLTTVNCSAFHIANNKVMTRLNLPNLKNMASSDSNDTEILLRADLLDRDFCITTQEMYNLINIDNINLMAVHGMHCEPAVPVTNGKVCNSSYTLVYPTEILDGCTQYFGSLVILPKNEKDVAKLKTVEIVFGPLYIAKTNLTNIDFLDNLKYISTLGYDTYAIGVVNNRFLSNFTFPSLKRIKYEDDLSVNFENNSQVMTLDPSYCFQLQNQLNLDGWDVPMFDKISCGGLKRAAENRPKSNGSSKLIVGFLMSFFSVIVLWMC